MQTTNREKLREQGYCIAQNIFDPQSIEKITRYCNKALESVSENHRIQFKAQGCLVDIADYPDFSEIIAHPALEDLFNELDLSGQVFGSGSVVSKQPGSPSLFWHQDWWGWDDSLSYTEQIPQVNVMIYLSPTSIENGCLRVIPGSHRQAHPIHEIPVEYGSSMSRVENPQHRLYQPWEGQCAVTVQPGDVVVKDTRLLHSTFPNKSNGHRTMLSLNFNPGFSSLPARMQARIRRIFMRQFDAINGLDIPEGMLMARWPDQHRERVEHLFPKCDDDVPPQIYNFSPKPELWDQVHSMV